MEKYEENLINQITLIKGKCKKGKDLRKLKNLSLDDGDLLKICEIFNIPIDVKRISDYQVEFDAPSLRIRVFDEVNNITYTSNYSNSSEVCGFMSEETYCRYINFSVSTDEYEYGLVYDIICKNFPLEKLKIKYNGYCLFYRRTLPGVINVINVQDGTQMHISFSKENDDPNDSKKEIDLTSSYYKTGYTYKKLSAFERNYVADDYKNNAKSRPDYFCFDVDSRYISGVKLTNKNYKIDGACFEIINEDLLVEALLNNYGNENIKSFSGYSLANVESAILYAGYSHFPKKSFYHDLEVNKRGNEFEIRYIIINNRCYPKKTVSKNLFVVPVLSSGKITIEEIDMIIEELKKAFGKDQFIQYVLAGIQDFKHRLQVRSNKEQEVLNPISPRILIDYSFEKIFRENIENMDSYFQFAKNQFDTMSEQGEIKEEKSRKRIRCLFKKD